MKAQVKSETEISERIRRELLTELQRLAETTKNTKSFYLRLGDFDEPETVTAKGNILKALQKEGVISKLKVYETETPPRNKYIEKEVSRLQEEAYRDELLEQQERVKGFDEEDFSKNIDPVVVAEVTLNKPKLAKKWGKLSNHAIQKLPAFPIFKNHKLILNNKTLADFTPKRGNPDSAKMSKVFEYLYRKAQFIEENKKTKRNSKSKPELVTLKELAVMAGSNSTMAANQIIKRIRAILEENCLPITVHSSLKTGKANMVITTTI